MISNFLALTLLASAAVALPSERHHTSHAVSKDTPPPTPKTPTSGRAAPIRRSSGLDAIGSPGSINNVLSIPILSNLAGDANSNSHSSLLDLRERGLLDDLDLNLLGTASENHQTTTNIVGDRNSVLTVAQKRALRDLRERGLLDDVLDDLDVNVLGDSTENHQTTTNVAGNGNDVTTLAAHKRALLDLGNVNVLGQQSESTTTTTNVQGNGNSVNVNSNNNNRDSVIDNSTGGGSSGPARVQKQKVYYDDEDDFVCTGSNRGRSGGQRQVKAHPTHTQRAVKQRKEASRSKAAKHATSTWKPTHRATNNYAAGCPAQQTATVTKWSTKWNQAAASTVTKWNNAATVTKWDTKTKTVTQNVFVATPTPTKNHLLGLDLDAQVGKIASAAADLNILRQ
ncbi:hypothetical protein JCM11491_002351 [Sporobolomyces phaffii]